MIKAKTPASPVCYHCKHSLTRPDIEIRAPSIPDTLGCNGLAMSQAAIVEEIVTATMANISELNREISQLEMAMQELQRKKISLQKFANNYKSLFVPVTRLPVNVISKIFQQSVIVPWLDIAWNITECACDKTPLAIASVCRQWRNVALSTPWLWSTLSLLLRPQSHQKLHRTPQYVAVPHW